MTEEIIENKEPVIITFNEVEYRAEDGGYIVKKKKKVVKKRKK